MRNFLKEKDYDVVLVKLNYCETQEHCWEVYGRVRQLGVKQSKNSYLDS